MLGRKTKTVLGLALAGLVAGTALTPGALAAQAEGPGTDVWMSVVPRPSDTRISVTIPTAIGFVVVGSTESTGAITVENGNLLLPNVKVEGDGTGDNKVTVTGESTLRMENYSTDVPEEQLNKPEGERKRIGLAVNVDATIKHQTDSAWTPIATEPGQAEGDAKKYQVSVGVSQTLGVFNKTEDGALRLDKPFTLPKPPVGESGWTTAGVSLVPSRTQLLLDIKVGGTQNMYTTTENSAKVAQIVWEITPIYDSAAP